MQTKDGGKHDILPVAGRPDHAGLPAYLPRKSDADMRRDGPGPCAHAPVDERGRLHGASDPQTASAIPAVPSERRTMARRGVFWSIEANRRKSWIGEQRRARLRRQDKSNAPLRSVCCGRSMGYGVPPEMGWCRFSGKRNRINANCATHRVFGCWRPGPADQFPGPGCFNLITLCRD